MAAELAVRQTLCCAMKPAWQADRNAQSSLTLSLWHPRETSPGSAELHVLTAVISSKVSCGMAGRPRK